MIGENDSDHSVEFLSQIKQEEQDETDKDGNCWHSYAVPYHYPFAAPTSPIAPAQSHLIPAGEAVTLPWGQSVIILDALQVENAVAYASALPLRSTRVLAENQTISGYRSDLSISEQTEMISLAWNDALFSLTLTLIQPDGSLLASQSDSRNVVHLAGSNYDYYFLKSPARGNWTLEVRSINPEAGSAKFSLMTGLVKGAPSLQLLSSPIGCHCLAQL